MSKLKRLVSLVLATMMLAGFCYVYAADSEISDLPEAVFDVYGSTLDRGFLVAKVDNGVFLSWRYFPEEATGTSDNGLVGADFAVFKNGVKIADITDSTDYLDADGTDSDEYTIVTVVGGEYVSKSKTLKPAPRLTGGISSGADSYGYLELAAERPAPMHSNANYTSDELSVGDVDGDGELEIVVKWATANPDVIQGGDAFVVYDAYKINADRTGMTLLWRLDMGVNIRGGQHYLMPMLYDFDGDGKAEFMVQTAPGTRYATATDGVLGDWNYITMVETVHTDWDGNKNWSHTDDYRSNDGSMGNDTRQDGKIFQWFASFFKNWQDHPEVREKRYGSDLELVMDSKDLGGYGWWEYPPQVLMGMYPAGYQKLDGTTVESAGRHDAYAAQSEITGWTSEQWAILNAMPKDPAAFKSHVITDEEATALAYLWMVNNFRDGGGRDRFRQSGHVLDGPEYFSVFNGATGAEMDTIPYAVPRGIVDPVTGKYYPDIGVMWNDAAGAWDEFLNRVERHNGGVGYLDGDDANPSCIQVRGYYSRTTITRYDWDGENLTSEVITDSGFEVLSNPFINSASGVGGAVAYGQTHASPGRREACFYPENPKVANPASIATVELAIKNGSITCQGQHSMSVMDLNGDGKDEIVLGSVAFNSDGSTLWAGYEQRWGTGDEIALKTGAIEELGHGDAMHLAYFDPDQETAKLYMCLEGSWWDAALLNAETGEVLYTDGGSSGTTSATQWGNQRDNGRAMVGKFTDESGWQLHSGQGRRTSPAGIQGGLRQSDGSTSAYNISPANAFSLMMRPNLLTQLLSGQNNIIVQGNNGIGGSFSNHLSTSGTRCQGGTKGQPALAADVFGDSREELFLWAGTGEIQSLRIYFNTEDSQYKLATLLADRRYRCEIERQKSCYNQPSYTSFYLGADMNMEIYANSIGVKSVSNEVIVEVGHSTIVEGLAAYINVSAAYQDAPVNGTAVLLIDGIPAYNTVVVDGKARMYIPEAPSAGVYTLSVNTDTAIEAFGETSITVVEYNRSIWTATAFQAESGNLNLKFSAKVGLKNASATVGDAAYAPSVSGSDTIELPVSYESLEAGTVVTVKGVVLTELFPSYTFTYKATVA